MARQALSSRRLQRLLLGRRDHPMARRNARAKRSMTLTRWLDPCCPAPGRRTPGNHGHGRAAFRRGIERGNLVGAELELRGMGVVTLTEALEYVGLLARKDRPRSRRAAARWLERYLAETGPSIADAAMVAALLAG